MNKSGLIAQTTQFLRENEINKTYRLPKRTFYVTDDEGNTKDFVFKGGENPLPFTQSDVSNIIDAFLDMIVLALQRGERVTINGFGSFYLKYHKPLNSMNDTMEEPKFIPGRYIVRYNQGKDMRVACQVYLNSMTDALSSGATWSEEGFGGKFDWREAAIDVEDDLEDAHGKDLESEESDDAETEMSDDGGFEE